MFLILFIYNLEKKNEDIFIYIETYWCKFIFNKAKNQF